MMKKDKGMAGAVFRYQDIFNFYSMELYAKVLSIKKMFKGKIKELAKIALPDFAAGKWYDFQIQVV